MIINHNIAAMNTSRQLGINSANTQKSLEKLSSGLRINRAGDDAAGLAISEKMRAQIRGLDQATRNAQDGISLVQTAEGGLNEVHSILQRMRELADQSANGTNTSADRQAISDEVTQLKQEIDRVGNTTEFNTQKLLNGDLKGAAGGSIGADTTVGGVVAKLTAGKMTAANALKGDQSTITFGTDTLTIDGQKIDVNWDTLLSTDQKAALDADLSAASQPALNSIRDTLINAINTAIDNSGKNVTHITGYLDAANKLNLQSGTTGTKSEVTVTTVAAATSVSALVLSQTAGAASAAANVGTSTYNGTAIAAQKFDVYVGDKLIGQSSALTVANGAAMSTAATALQTAVNAAITAYNTATGKTSGQEGFIEATTVTVSDDGRFNISSPSGGVGLKDLEGVTAVSDLGLSAAQTDSGAGGGVSFQIGANRGQSISFSINDMRSAALGVSSIDVSTQPGASAALTALDKAITTVSSQRAKLGAVQNRLEHTINNLGTSSENLSAAESRIRDVDMAKEMMTFTKNNILSQAAQAMLAQANQQPQGVLQLLR